MSNELLVLVIAACNIAILHTFLGPDHYLPFVLLAKSRQWSMKKTAWITFLCGVGHIIGSIVLGLVGISIGIALNKMVAIESVRGDIAAWLFISFGLIYFVWGVRHAWKNRPHTHWHTHADGTVHNHSHTHHGEHAHVHDEPAKISITPWALFIIFVLGPCESLIPFLTYKAANMDMFGLLVIVIAFGIATILTMLTLVMVGVYGMSFLPMAKMQRYAHALSGATIFMCGFAIQFLGL